MAMAKLEVEDIKPRLGSILRADRESLFEEDVIESCRELLDARSVLVFPRIGLSDAEQLEFTDRLGTRVKFTGTVPGADAVTEGIYTISLDPELNDEPEYVQGTFFWHMDGLTSDIPPPKATLLSCRRTAPKGGQTEFCSTVAAYELLPDEDKAEIEELRAVHSLATSLRQLIDGPPTEEDRARYGRGLVKDQPLVWKRRSGRRSLILGNSADRIVDMPLPEGRALLARLLEWTAQPDFSYRHRWQEGDLVIWDNCGVLHRVIPYAPGSGRTMHRTSLAGEEAIH